MDNRVRDLDQIQEDEDEDGGRRLGTLLMGSAAIVGLTLAVGVVVGRAAEPAPQVEDPLAKLERSAAAASSPAAATKAERAAPKVEAADLSFPTALTEDEERPEVLAALKAAQAEAAALAPAEVAAPAGPAPAVVPATQAKPSPAHQADDDDDDGPSTAPARRDDPPAPPSEAAPEGMVANVPAAVAAAASARNIRKAASHDPLVAAAVHATEDAKPAAPHGHDGEYTLQVISYDRAEASRAFADGLRQKGHTAFVVAADVPERGRYYRVRIGPFKTREAAEAYRHKFEEQEHMNTFVVHDKHEG